MNKKDSRDSHARVCLSRLTRVLDLDMLEELQQLEHTGNVSRNCEIDNNLRTHRSFFSKSSEKISKIMNRKGHRIFGQSLTEDAVQRISGLIQFLKSHQSKEGLFRISGSKKRQEELMDMLDKEEHIDFNGGQFTAHDVASVLKCYLGELPEPLLTQAPRDAYMQVTEIRNDESSSKLVEALQLLFLLVPPQNRLLLQQLLELLNLVAENQQNKMTAYNLAVVFSPNIMAHKKQLNCLNRFPDDLSVMHKLVAAMIHHAKELFKIPKGLREEIEASEETLKKGSEELPVTRTFCQQMDQLYHKQTVQQTTSDALVQLYNHVMDMPDGPIRQKFMERFEKMHPGTPPFIPRTKKRGKLEASTPLKSMQSPAALIGSELSPISRRQSTQTPALKKRVAFDVVDTPSCPFPNTPAEHRETPFRSWVGATTPSGVMRTCDSSFVKSKRVRTRSVSSLENFSSPIKHSRTRTVHTPGNKRRLRETPYTPSGLIGGFIADVSYDDSFTCSSSKRRATPLNMPERLPKLDYSMEEYFI